MAKKRTPLAVSNATGVDVHYIELRFVMEPLVAMIDGLALTYFGKSKRAYLRLEDAINWAAKEFDESPTAFNKKRIDALREIERRVLAGETNEQ